MSRLALVFLILAVFGVCTGSPLRQRRQLLNAVVDAAKSAGHGIAAVGSGLTLQGDKAGRHAEASVGRADGALGNLGRAIYNPNKA